jgi:hypothetical protein
MEMTAEQHRQAASDANRREQESWDRCDTDGFVSQFAHGLNAQEHILQAEILEAGGVAQFPGLYQGERRVKAQLIQKPAYGAPWRKESIWMLENSEVSEFDRRFIPADFTGKGRIQKQLGLKQRWETAPAKAKIIGHGTGLSGLSSCTVGAVRIGDRWGQDAVLFDSKAD